MIVQASERRWQGLLAGLVVAACTFPHYNVGRDDGAAGASAGGKGGVSGASGTVGAEAGDKTGEGGALGGETGAAGARSDAGAAGAGPTPGALLSLDLRGDCRGGKPSQDGETTTVEELHGYDVTAYGSEMGHHCTQDQGRFVYLEVTGDFDVAVQVSAMDNFGAPQGNYGSPVKAGLIAREGLEPASRYVGIWAVQPVPFYPDAFQFDFRKMVAGAIVEGGFEYGFLNMSSPLFQRKLPNIWVRLSRSGSKFSAYASQDGVSWTAPSTASFTNDFGSKIYLGLAQASAPNGSYDVRSVVQFRNLSGLEGAAAAQQQ